MREITVKLYQYDELSEKAKGKALDWMYKVSAQDEWWDFVYADAETIGLKIKEFDIDRGSYVKAEFRASAEETAHKIESNHGESSETYKAAKEYLAYRDKLINEWPKDSDGEFENEGDMEDALDKLDAEFLKTLQEDYLSLLREEYEYRTSREALEEDIRANEYEFTGDGRRA